MSGVMGCRACGGLVDFRALCDIVREDFQGEKNMANVHPVNKIVYIIIAFFLGGLGIQDGLPALFALVRIIMAIFARSDANGNIVI